uniref:Putative cytoplasmic protein n=1 Tax=Streptomyces platensis TaxID=58346 RepID=D3Y137_STRPT|nr:putative cytoplasmic protein [Streptomyces platensis]
MTDAVAQVCPINPVIDLAPRAGTGASAYGHDDGPCPYRWGELMS